MKKIALLMFLVVICVSVSGCGSSYNPKVENFEAHLASLADDPEGRVDVVLKYNRTDDLEDAFTKLSGYTSKDWYVSQSDAEDAWIYLSHYIDALHAEIAALYEEYHDAH